jgi:hypothetical protein
MAAVELHGAVATGDVIAVRGLLEAGAEVDQRDEFGSTPLHRATWQGDLAIVSVLLEAGADAGAQRVSDKRAPLDLAEMRARGLGYKPPAGLSEEKLGAGDFKSISSALRERTSGSDVVLTLHKQFHRTADEMEVRCINIRGNVVAIFGSEESKSPIFEIQEELAQRLGISPTRLRLVLPENRLPTENENLKPLGDVLLQQVPQHALPPTVMLGHQEAMTSSDASKCFHLNQLSCSSNASTCASSCNDNTRDLDAIFS